MIKNVSSKLRQFLVAFVICAMPAAAAEILAAAAGAAISSGASGYMQETFGVVKSIASVQKTFDNEYNEAVCGFQRDKMRKLIEGTLKEFDLQANESRQAIDGKGTPGFDPSIFVTLGQRALQMTLRHDLAAMTVDLVDVCKALVFEKIDSLNRSLNIQHSARMFGEAQARDLDKTRSERVDKAVQILTIWKNNLLAAVHEKYPYDCEGGLGDRWNRQAVRRGERAKEWRIEADWFGRVNIPKMDLQSMNPFKPEDINSEAKIIYEIQSFYSFVFEFVRKSTEDQIGTGNRVYLDGISKYVSENFPDIKLTSSVYTKPKILLAYEQYLNDSEHPR